MKSLTRILLLVATIVVSITSVTATPPLETALAPRGGALTKCIGKNCGPNLSTASSRHSNSPESTSPTHESQGHGGRPDVHISQIASGRPSVHVPRPERLASVKPTTPGKSGRPRQGLKGALPPAGSYPKTGLQAMINHRGKSVVKLAKEKIPGTYEKPGPSRFAPVKDRYPPHSPESSSSSRSSPEMALSSSPSPERDKKGKGKAPVRSGKWRGGGK